jgi:hypothetical protein
MHDGEHPNIIIVLFVNHAVGKPRDEAPSNFVPGKQTTQLRISQDVGQRGLDLPHEVST